MISALKLSIRSLLFRKKQYISLFLVCVLGSGISMLSLFVLNGMLFSLEEKARIYYGGDMQFIGGKNELRFDDTESAIQKLQTVFPDALIAERFDFDAQRASLYFEGLSVRQRVIKGVDFEHEKKLFSSINFVEGSSEGMNGTNGILLSAPCARKLNVQTGDNITLMLYSSNGHINTAELTVRGIFTDSSLFGMYTSYMDLNVLRNLYEAKNSFSNRICINFGGRSFSESELENFQGSLENLFTMFPLVKDKQAFYDKLLSSSFSEPTYLLVPLEANLRELRMLIFAMKAVSFFIILILVFIIVVGIAGTYKVIVLKRINEIGIYMALGMEKRDINRTFSLESLCLLVSGCAAGTVFACILSAFFSGLRLSFLPAFDIFLINGSLMPRIEFMPVFTVSLAVIFFTMTVIRRSLKKITAVMPAKALSAVS
ncbi:MAG: FtsX-like permease family protein [Treponema sp.]|nr:FtsX-like permease family protein [Treponema sp.]